MYILQDHYNLHIFLGSGFNIIQTSIAGKILKIYKKKKIKLKHQNFQMQDGKLKTKIRSSWQKKTRFKLVNCMHI